MSNNDDRHLFRIDDGELHWYSAVSPEQAEAMHIEQYDYEDGEASIARITILPDEQTFTLVMRDEEDQPEITKTAGEWAAEHEGFIGSTVY